MGWSGGGDAGRQGMEIGSTADSPVLTNLSESEMEKEIRGSRT